MAERVGQFTLRLNSRPSIISFAGVVGKKEGEGPLREDFDEIFEDTSMGENSWEKSESTFQKKALEKAIAKANLEANNLDYVFAGDLLAQSIGTTFGLKDKNVPLIGVYGACSTMALSLSMAACFREGGLCNNAAALTSSHFCSSERQFRFPLEYGGQRTPSSQWTVTGAGAAIVSGHSDTMPTIEAVTIGKIVEMGITDANNMGGAMAPAAADTIKNFFTDSSTNPSDYDLILTGDLGSVGSRLLYDLLQRENYDIKPQHKDCGIMIFDPAQTDVFAGGSGCGCSASVFCSHILKSMQAGVYKNILFVATGALLSPTSTLQGEVIPAIAHLVHITIQ